MLDGNRRGCLRPCNNNRVIVTLTISEEKEKKATATEEMVVVPFVVVKDAAKNLSPFWTPLKKEGMPNSFAPPKLVISRTSH